MNDKKEEMTKEEHDRIIMEKLRMAEQEEIMKMWDSSEIIKQDTYEGITYIIRKVNWWFCAYIIVEEPIKEEDVASVEITYSDTLQDCSFIEDKTLGKYVIGWDYAHFGQEGTTIVDIMEDVEQVVDEIKENEEQ